MGLLNRITNREELMPLAMELARNLAQKPGAAVKIAKANINTAATGLR
jgi:1,4-dihydroxy-2-naphthoyl-CoA synthase